MSKRDPLMPTSQEAELATYQSGHVNNRFWNKKIPCWFNVEWFSEYILQTKIYSMGVIYLHFVTGKPIECINEIYKDKIHVINTFCWIQSTYTLPGQLGQPVGTHVAAPGVGSYVHGLHEVKYHNYYQWVPFVLFLQVMQHFVLTHQQSLYQITWSITKLHVSNYHSS